MPYLVRGWMYSVMKFTDSSSRLFSKNSALMRVFVLNSLVILLGGFGLWFTSDKTNWLLLKFTGVSMIGTVKMVYPC